MPSYWHNVHARMLSHVALAKLANEKAHMHGKEVVLWMDIVDSLVGWLVETVLAIFRMCVAA
jgi:hypothetical protein